MTVKITKTSAQAQIERTVMIKENSCPECGELAIGVTHSKGTGFFNVKTVEKNSYSCWKCGCQWETDWTRK